MKYRIYEVNLMDEATLQMVVDDEDKAKLMRNLLYTVSERAIQEGEQFEHMRYIIISDMD